MDKKSINEFLKYIEHFDEDFSASDFLPSELKVKKGEPLERVLRRLKKRLDREGVIREVRNHRYFEKPCEKRRRKMKVARFSAMLAARYADM